MIAIVDYGMGNLRSVQKAFLRLDYKADVVSQPGAVGNCELLVLPGVGAFDRAVENLKQRRLWRPVLDHLEAAKPYLGICLGLQLLFEGSAEGKRNGFSIFPGEVSKFRNIEPVPHMGWNEVCWQKTGRSLAPSQVDKPSFYFVHSYFPRPKNDSIVAARTEYGENFCSAIKVENCLGVQFHPEKSQLAGLDLLQRFCEKLQLNQE